MTSLTLRERVVAAQQALRLAAACGLFFFAIASRDEALRPMGVDEKVARVSQLGRKPKAYNVALRGFVYFHELLLFSTPVFLFYAAMVGDCSRATAFAAVVPWAVVWSIARKKCVLALLGTLSFRRRRALLLPLTLLAVRLSPIRGAETRAPHAAALFALYQLAEAMQLYPVLPFSLWLAVIVFLLGCSLVPHVQPFSDAAQALTWLQKQQAWHDNNRKNVEAAFASIGAFFTGGDKKKPE